MRTGALRNLLTVVLVLLCGGIGYLFYYMLAVFPKQGMTQNAMKDAYQNAVKVGSERQPPDKRWRYTQADREKYWRSFEKVNIIGKLPPEPERPATQPTTEKPPPPPLQPLEKIFTLAMVLGGDKPEHGGMVTVVYKPEANAVPDVPRMLIASSAPAFTGSVRGDTPPNPAPVSPMGPSGANPGKVGPQNVPGLVKSMGDPVPDLSHNVYVGKALWKPFQEITLVRIISDDSGGSAVFRRPDGKGGHQEDTIYLEYDASIAALGIPTSRPGASGGVGRTPPSAKRTAVQWVDLGDEKSKEINNVWHISRKDELWFSENYDRSLAEDLHVEPYHGSRRIKDPATGKEVGSGLQVTRVGSSLQRFGIQPGDLLIDLNGVPISSKAQLVKVGREMYDNGTREFTARILSRGEFVTKTYRVPDR